MRASTKQKEVVVSTWSINGGFVVVTYMRPTKDVTQGATQGATQGVTKDVTKVGIQDDNFDKWIENQIKQNLKLHQRNSLSYAKVLKRSSVQSLSK